MNTRLQVEHPVTEKITGLDLVELMIKVAAGEELPVAQQDIGIHGWSMESRIYAESPFRNFLPSTGRLVGYQAPAESETVRVDTGVLEGSEISMFYDPMIAKLVTWGETRDEAIKTMRTALDQYYIRGVDTNQPFVSAIMAHPRFVAGELTTHFIDEEYPEGFSENDTAEVSLDNLIVVSAALHDRLSRRAASTSGQLPGYGRVISKEWVVVTDGKSCPVTIDTQEGSVNAVLDGKSFQIEDDWTAIQPVFQGQINGQQVNLQVEKTGYAYWITMAGRTRLVRVLSPRAAELNQLMPEKIPPDMSGYLLAPMPGLLVSVAVEKGQSVKEGEELAVIEAMKMENSMRAQQDGVIAEIIAQPGSTLEVDQPILSFEKGAD